MFVRRPSICDIPRARRGGSVSPRILVAALFAGASVVLVMVTVWQLRARPRVPAPPRPEFPEANLVDARAPAPEGAFSVSHAGGADARVPEVKAALRDGLARPGASPARRPPRYDALIDDAARALAVYTAGTPEEFGVFLAAHDAYPRDGLATPEDLEQLWKRGGLLLEGGWIDAGAASIRMRFLDGTPTSDPDAWGPQSSASRMPRSFFDDFGRGGAPGLTMYEIVAPARLRTIDGKRFVARIAFRFVFDQTAQRWKLMESALYDAPDSASVAMPPI